MNEPTVVTYCPRILFCLLILFLFLFPFSTALMNKWQRGLSHLKLFSVVQKTSLFSLICALNLVNLIDWWITAIGVSSLSLATEGNPLIAYFVMQGGFSRLFLFKVSLFFVVLPVVIYGVGFKVGPNKRITYRKISASYYLLVFTLFTVGLWSGVLFNHYLQGGKISLLTPHEAFTLTVAPPTVASDLVF
ncbi:MAG: hypothetical protein KDD55_07865 [Bdellovibrionales bacterium]|nr:hypothetical protein [Bdellovibrionales bacterium]